MGKNMNIKKVVAFIFLCLSSASALCAQVNINTASADEIADSLTGIGKKKATAIIEYREKYGDFTSKQQITNINGIGNKTLKKNSSDIQL